VPLLAANQLFAPAASRLYSRGERADLVGIYSAVTRWIFTVSLVLFVLIGVFRLELLGLFGPEFTAGTAVLVLMLVGQLCNAATGPSGYLLMMTDHQYVVMANEWVFGIANVVLTVVFIHLFDLVGAALASAAVLALRNLTKLAEVWYFERMAPYGRSFVKPVLAGTLTAGALLTVQPVLPGGSLALVVGLPIGLAVYVGALRFLGIESVDADLYAQLVE